MFAPRAGVEDPKSKLAPKFSIFNSGDYGELLSTRGCAASIAHAAGGKAETILNELIANLVSNSRMAPAGIVAVNRARSEDIRL
jgi:hypothetical protein